MRTDGGRTKDPFLLGGENLASFSGTYLKGSIDKPIDHTPRKIFIFFKKKKP